LRITKVGCVNILYAKHIALTIFIDFIGKIILVWGWRPYTLDKPPFVHLPFAI
jgi:hypothetical protein